jgi:hypothetical protein
MRRYAMLALLLVVGACGGRRAPGPLPAGWKRVTIERAFTVDVPEWMKDEKPRLFIDHMPSDPDASGGMEGPERRFHWALYGPRNSYFSNELAKQAQRHPVWWSERLAAWPMNRPGHEFTDADSIQVTHMLVRYRRLTVEATLLEPVPGDTTMTRKVLGSVHILSDGE